MNLCRVQEGGEPVQARILIGADGYFSRVRECMLGDGPPAFEGRVTWRTRVSHGRGLPTVGEAR
jgi:2-polyprenyl-6-methoxyphenol hydroxylase-like FAD-dependent oxidoreductase